MEVESRDERWSWDLNPECALGSPSLALFFPILPLGRGPHTEGPWGASSPHSILSPLCRAGAAALTHHEFSCRARVESHRAFNCRQNPSPWELSQFEG